MISNLNYYPLLLNLQGKCLMMMIIAHLENWARVSFPLERDASHWSDQAVIEELKRHKKMTINVCLQIFITFGNLS